MDDSFLYSGNAPVQSKSNSFINYQPEHFFNMPQLDAPNIVANKNIFSDDNEPTEIDSNKNNSLFGLDIGDLTNIMLKKKLLKSLYPDIPLPKTMEELSTTIDPVKSQYISKPDESLDPNNPFLYKDIDMGFTFDHEQGNRNKMHDAYMNGSYALRGPGILDTTWQAFANATGDSSYKNWANMDNTSRTNLVRKFMGWYLDPVINKYDLSKLTQRQRNMIADISWEYGQYSNMVRDAYNAFLSNDPQAFANLKNNVGNYYKNSKNKQFKDWGLKRWDARLKYLYD